MSTGIAYGLKLPTGNNRTNTAIVDTDTQIGTGSTDVLLGGFYRRNLTNNSMWTGFTQAQLDMPVLIQNQYRLGWETDLAGVVVYNGWATGDVMVSPIAKAIVSVHGRDSGANAASPVASGCERLILSVGLEADVGSFSFYTDFGVPVLQNVNGNQLTAPYMVTAVVSFRF